MIGIRFKRFLAAGCALAALADASRAAAQEQPAAAPAPAQPTPAQNATSANEEIVVTAQKRAQNLNDVGLTISVASAEMLQKRGVVSVGQLNLISPSFSVGTAFTGAQFFSLRGINFNTSQISASPTISTYVDEAILPYAAMTGAMLLDVERVEVLKGPQGTLFGQNATAGAINVIAAKPTSTLKAGFHSEVDNFGQVFVEGFVSGPISDTLRARVAASTTQFGAWQHGYYLTPRSEKIGDQDKLSGRLLLDWTPTSRLKVSVNLNASQDKSDLQAFQIGTIAPLAPGGELPQLDSYKLPTNAREADFNFKPHRNDRLYQGVLRIDYKLADSLTFTSISNYADYKQDRYYDADGTALNIQNFGPTGRIKSFSQELRISGSSLDDRLHFIAGGNYQKDRIVDALENDLIAISSLPPGTDFSTSNRIVNKSIGGFANADLEIIKHLTVTGGLRYTEAKQSTSGCATASPVGTALGNAILGGFRFVNGLAPVAPTAVGQCITVLDEPLTPGGSPPYVAGTANVSRKEHNLAFRAGINYKFGGNNLLYGLISRGYKSGGYPVAAALLTASGDTPFKQEELLAYEAGVKLSSPDRKFNLNVAGFYYDYTNKQFLTYVPLIIVQINSIVQNVPKSNAKGVDIDATIRPVAGLTLRGAVTYVDTKVGNFQTYTGSLVPINVKGNRFSFAPEWSGTTDAEYRFPVATNIEAYTGASLLFNSHAYSDLTESPLTAIPGYLTVDARVGVESSKGWTAGLFVRNLTNKYYWTSAFRTADIYGKIAGRPRTFGGSVSFRF